MSKIPEELEHQTLTECGYSFPVETLNDTRGVRAAYRDLRLYLDFYCSRKQNRKKLLYLTGTIPVPLHGNVYNIPVCIWLHETHPVSRPRCSVCPSFSMVINPACPYVDLHGNITLSYLSNWTTDVSSLSGLVAEMRRAFQQATPLYATLPVPLGVSCSRRPSLISNLPAADRQSERSGQGMQRSYTEELLGIDFSAPPPSSSPRPLFPPPSPESVSPLLRNMQLSQMTATRGQTTPTRDQALHDPDKTQNQPKRPEHDQLLLQASLPPDKAATFGSLLAMEGQCFNPDDVLEAVQSNRDLSSALRYLSHSCPICAEQLSFSKMVTMTHCSCSFCETCFKTYFSAAIREKSIDKLVCPLCSQPEIRGCGGWEQSMDYFNLLDTQIRHHLGPQSHQLFQEKLRDRALQEMPNFCWCAHCSFGVLHEAEQLMMKCPNCKKTTCSKCRSAWAPQHQGVSCEEFKRWQLRNEPERRTLQLPSRSHIECPNCRLLFHLSRGGCLHFRCSQCQHHFCGSCSQTFSLGASCSFSASCSAKGLHAHHPRNCLYHLRDWSSSRLLQLLQFYRVSPSWPSADFPEAAGGACPVLQLAEENSPMEEACSRPSARNQGGLCQLHYKEHLVDQVQQNLLDPVVLFSRSELEAEFQRWCIAAPKQEAQEEEPLYMQRLLLALLQSVPLKKPLSSHNDLL